MATMTRPQNDSLWTIEASGMSARSQPFIAIIAATLLFATQLSTARADDPFRDLHFITENYVPSILWRVEFCRAVPSIFSYACSPSPNLRK